MLRVAASVSATCALLRVAVSADEATAGDQCSMPGCASSEQVSMLQTARARQEEGRSLQAHSASDAAKLPRSRGSGNASDAAKLPPLPRERQRVGLSKAVPLPRERRSWREREVGRPDQPHRGPQCSDCGQSRVGHFPGWWQGHPGARSRLFQRREQETDGVASDFVVQRHFCSFRRVPED